MISAELLSSHRQTVDSCLDGETVSTGTPGTEIKPAPTCALRAARFVGEFLACNGGGIHDAPFSDDEYCHAFYIGAGGAGIMRPETCTGLGAAGFMTGLMESDRVAGLRSRSPRDHGTRSRTFMVATSSFEMKTLVEGHIEEATELSRAPAAMLRRTSVQDTAST
jgi:hypothetical protein